MTCVQAASEQGSPLRRMAGGVRSGWLRFSDAFRLIAASPYLLHVCAFLVLNYIVSSFFYFEKSLVVASGVAGSAARAELFATINGISALMIALVQVSMTGFCSYHQLHQT